MHLAGEPVHLAGRLRPVHFTGKPPPWFSKVKVRLAFLSTQLRLKWDRATETKIRRLIDDHIPTHCPFMMSVNADASDSLHMEMLRHALDSGSMKWFERATQFGRRHASFPFLYDWDTLMTGKPFLRSQLTKELRRALDIALFYIDEADRKQIISLIAPKSFRSGAATAIVTATNAGFVAAAFLGHGNTQVTKQYYHKGDDGERLQLIGPLSNGLRNSGPAAAGRLVGSHAKWTRAGPLGSESVTLSDVRVSHA